MIEETLYAHLKTNVTSVSNRVYPMIMPQDCVKPALVYTVVNEGDNQTGVGCVSSKNTRIQIDIYSTSYSEVKSILTEVKSALYSFDSFPLGFNSRDGYEEDQTLFRQILDFTLRN